MKKIHDIPFSFIIMICSSSFFNRQWEFYHYFTNIILPTKISSKSYIFWHYYRISKEIDFSLIKLIRYKNGGSFLIDTHLQPSSTSTYHNSVSTETIKVKEVHGHHHRCYMRAWSVYPIRQKKTSTLLIGMAATSQHTLHSSTSINLYFY